MNSSIRYFNAPVQLLEGFLIDHKIALNNILYYGIYSHSIRNGSAPSISNFISSAEYLLVELSNVDLAYKKGIELYSKFGRSSPKFGISRTIFWNYYKAENKEPFELACLLSYLAMKSIIQSKTYCKITNKYLLSRMAGKPKNCELDQLPIEIKKYANEYQLKKIKNNLCLENWGLVTYGHTRGFYISFKLSLEDLIYIVEKNKLKNKQKEYKLIQDEALKKARNRIEFDMAKTRPIER
jgi:hypothetical protein